MSKQPLQAALMKHSLILLNVLDLDNWHDRVSPKQQLEGWRGPAEQTPVCSRHLSEEQYFREAWGSGGVESESGTRETGTVSGTSGSTKGLGSFRQYWTGTHLAHFQMSRVSLSTSPASSTAQRVKDLASHSPRCTGLKSRNAKSSWKTPLEEGPFCYIHSGQPASLGPAGNTV